MRRFLAGLRRRSIARQASRWHVRMERPRSTQEVEAFEAWLDADPSHAVAYADIEMLAQSGQRASWPMPSVIARGVRPAFAIAIITALIVCSTLLFAFPSSSPAVAAISNPGPGVKTLAFSDGSDVVMDVGAEVGLLTTDRERRIEVRNGRARIIVQPGALRAVGIVTPLGEARFQRGIVDVVVEPNRSLLTAVERPVRVSFVSAEPEGTIGLARGETLQAMTNGYTRLDLRQDDDRWPLARHAFDRTRLRDIAPLANRSGKPPHLVVDEDVANLAVTGVFDLRDTRGLAAKIAAALDLEVSEQANTVTLKR